MQRMQPRALVLTGLVVLVLALVVYPTLYVFSTITVAGTTMPVRVNRITGHVDVATGAGWQPIEGMHLH